MRKGTKKRPVTVKDRIAAAFIRLLKKIEVMGPQLGQPACDARTDVPDIRQGLVVPEGLAESSLVQVADVVLSVFGGDVQGHLGQEQVGAYASGGADTGLLEHRIHQGHCQLLAGHVIEAKVGGGVDEALVDGVDVDVLRADVAEIDAVDPGGDLHVVAHLGFGHDVVHIFGDLVHPAPVGDTQLLHGGGDG